MLNSKRVPELINKYLKWITSCSYQGAFVAMFPKQRHKILVYNNIISRIHTNVGNTHSLSLTPHRTKHTYTKHVIIYSAMHKTFVVHVKGDCFISYLQDCTHPCVCSQLQSVWAIPSKQPSG